MGKFRSGRSRLQFLIIFIPDHYQRVLKGSPHVSSKEKRLSSDHNCCVGEIVTVFGRLELEAGAGVV